MNKKGFTLAELLLAAAVLVLTLAGLLALFISCAMLNDASRNATTAISHARVVLEDIRNAGFTGLETRINGGGTNGWDFTAAQLQTAYSVTPLTNETVATAVTQAGDPVYVSVTINWRDRGNRQRTTTLNTAVTTY